MPPPDLSQSRRPVVCLAIALMLAWSLVATPSWAARAPAAYPFDIPAMPLAEALVKFSQITGLPILAAGPLVSNKQSAALEGAWAPKDALQQLLAGTGLVAQVKTGKTFILTAAPRQARGMPPSLSDASGTQAETPDALPAPAKIEEIFVTEGRDPNDRTIIAQEAQRLLDMPGTLDDPMWGLMASPAITFGAAAYNGELIIRGSSPDDHLVLIDGMQVGYLFHQFGDSILSRNAVQRLDLQPSAFSAQYGGAIGSVLDIGLRHPDVSKGLSGTIDISKMRAGLHLEGPVGRAAGFFVNARVNALHLFHPTFDRRRDLAPQANEVPRNVDYTSRYRHSFGDASVTATIIGARDKQAFRANTALADPFLNEQTKTDFHTQALAFEKRWNSRTALNIVLSHTGKSEHRTLGANGFEKATTDGIYLRSKFDILRDGQSLTFGGNITLEKGRYDYNTRLLFCDDFTGQCPSSDVERRSRTNTLKDLEIFGISQVALGDAMTLEIGAQISRDFFLKETFLEPRLSLFWQASPVLQLYTRYGRHHQRQDIRRYLELRYTAAAQANDTADHYLLGSRMTFARGWSITSEAYYRHQNSALYQASSQERHVSGNIYGLELSIVKGASGLGLSGSVSIGYTKSGRRDKTTGQAIRYRYNRPLNAMAELAWHLPGGWRLGARYQHQSGLPFTPVTGATIGSDGSKSYHYAPLFSARTGSHNRLDLRVEKRTDHGFGTITYHLDVINALDQASPAPPLYHGVFLDERGVPQPQTYDDHGLPRLVSFGLTIGF